MTLTWRRSSRSGAGGSVGGSGDCVEVAFSASGPLLRDSKIGDAGPVLYTSHAAFEVLVRTLKQAR